MADTCGTASFPADAVPTCPYGQRRISSCSRLFLCINGSGSHCTRSRASGGAKTCTAPRADNTAALNGPSLKSCIGFARGVVGRRSRIKTCHGEPMSNALPAPGPELPTAGWRETYDTLHLWTQIVGKIRYARSPWLNHSWHVALYVTARGLTTSQLPDGARSFQIDFDFIDHMLWARTSDGHFRQLVLKPMSVAEFYVGLLAALREL